MRTKVSGPESLELALEMKKKASERLTQLSDSGHDTFSWMCGGLIDRYSGIDHENESQKS